MLRQCANPRRRGKISLITWKGKLNQPFKEEMQLRGLKFQVLGFGVYFEVSRFRFQGSSFHFFSCTHDLKDITKFVIVRVDSRQSRVTWLVSPSLN